MAAIDSYDLRTLFCPPYSPDLNPIENIWSILKQRVAIKIQNTDSVDSEDMVWQVIQECWNEIPAETFQRVIDSMPARINSLLEKLGSHLDY